MISTKGNHLNLHDYQPLALRTEKPLPLLIDRLAHAGLGIDTETGELNTIIKRVHIYGKSLDDIGESKVDPATGLLKTKTLRECAGEEIADVCWYVAIACDALGYDMGEFGVPSRGLTYPLDDLALNLQVYSGKFADPVLLSKKLGRASLHGGDRTFALDVLANLMRVLSSVCDAMNLDLGLLLDANIAKLRERFPNAYSDAAAEARADKGGLDARNS